MTWPAAARECPIQGSQSDRITDGSDRRRSTRTRIFSANNSRTSGVVDTHGSYCFSRMPPELRLRIV
jgi:hypothetical protein